MQCTSVAIISPSADLGVALSRSLSAGRFELTDIRPGPAVLRDLRRCRPEIAIVDRIDERPEAAQLEIALIKEICPETPIIALSRDSSESDASVVEQGLFYYMAAPSNGDLIRVIDAAQHSILAGARRRG